MQQIGHLRAYIFTAIRPATGEDVALVPPAVSTASMQVLLDHAAPSRPADAHLVLVLDGAGRRASRDLVVSPSITLLVLPPSSPKLDPVERVRLYLRGRLLSPRLLHPADAIIDARCDARNRLTAEPRPISPPPRAPVDREGRAIEAPV